MLSRLTCLALFLTASLVTLPTSAAEPELLPISGAMTVSPASIKLIHHRQPQSLIVSGRTADGIAVDLTGAAKFRSGDEAVVLIENGIAKPRANGQTTIIIEAAGQLLSVPVVVELSPVERPLSFRHEVMPVLSKGGCNSGSCHGYSLGKGGFKLSLRGADPLKDHQAIFAEEYGRRVNRLKPIDSLLIQKPVGAVPHRGGTRFAHGTLSQQILERWVAEGAKPDFEDKSEVESVSIFPERFVLEPNMKHRLQLIAHYTDGTHRDVTPLAIFNVNTEGVAEVADGGLVTTRDLGESAVVARFERKFAAARLIVLKRHQGFEPSPVPQDQFIDQFVTMKLNDLKVRPSEASSDQEFLRRVSIDLIGLQPLPDDVRKFVADTDPNKRSAAIDALFARPEFVDHWSLKWGDLLQNSRVRLSEPAVYAFREWIRSAIASNMPMDQFARELLTSRGGATDNAASGYFAVARRRKTVARSTATLRQQSA